MTELGAVNLARARFMVERLRQYGVAHVGVAPGSRSSPLALAVAANNALASSVHFDERGLAYHAVGLMRGSGKPAAIICTSGTAVANFLPAVIEASMDSLPLVVLTADRPPELRNCGANQTIDQLRIFGNHVNYFADLPCPDESEYRRDVVKHIDGAMRSALTPRPGPVHLNCPCREPLIMSDELSDTCDPDIPGQYRHHEAQPPDINNPVAHATLDELFARLPKAKRGLVIVGRLSSPGEQQAVARFCRRLGWPVAADITSGLRTSADILCGAHDLVFKNETLRERLGPDFVLHLGGQLVSKHLVAFLGERRNVQYWSCPGRYRTFDPARAVTRTLTGDLTQIAAALCAAEPPSPDPNYRHLYLSAFDTVECTVDRYVAEHDAFAEFTLARYLGDACDGDHLFLASSLTIRDFDWFTPRRSKLGMVAANRGASGIDGTVASAVGFARGLKAPVNVVLGDQAMLHDLNSLALAAKSEYPVTIIVVNNRGGRIFEMLPEAQHREHFERFFAAAHDFTFENAAVMFGLPHARVETNSALVDSWRAARASSETKVIEAAVVPAAASHARHEVFDLIDKKLSEL